MAKYMFCFSNMVLGFTDLCILAVAPVLVPRRAPGELPLPVDPPPYDYDFTSTVPNNENLTPNHSPHSPANSITSSALSHSPPPEYASDQDSLDPGLLSSALTFKYRVFAPIVFSQLIPHIHVCSI